MPQAVAEAGGVCRAEGSCSPGRRDVLFRRGPWGFSSCFWCHPEERSDEGSAFAFSVGFAFNVAPGTSARHPRFGPLWHGHSPCIAVPVPGPSFRARCPARPDAKRHASKIVAPERSSGARGAYSAAEVLRRIPPRLCSSLFRVGSSRRPSRRRAGCAMPRRHVYARKGQRRRPEDLRSTARIAYP
jgi:hypothetical protein